MQCKGNNKVFEIKRSERRFDDIVPEDTFVSQLHKPSHYYISLQIAKTWRNLPCKIQAASIGCFYKIIMIS